MVAGRTITTNVSAATRPAVARKTAAASGEDTRARIIAAAVETLNEVGIVGASARTIARNGEFNQALIFYHFGSVEGLLVAAAKMEGSARSARYAEKFGRVNTIAELVTIARSVHQQEQADGAVNVLSQLLAGSMSAPALRVGLLEAMTPWMELVEQAVRQVLGDGPLAAMAPVSDMAFAISSLFLGLELMTALDPSGQRATSLFDTVEALSAVVEPLISGPLTRLP